MAIPSSLPVTPGTEFVRLRADFYGACSAVKSGGATADRADAIVLDAILWFWDLAVASGKRKIAPENRWISPGNTAISRHCCGGQKPDSIATCLRRLADRGFIKIQPGAAGEANKIQMCHATIKGAIREWLGLRPEEPPHEPEQDAPEAPEPPPAPTQRRGFAPIPNFQDERVRRDRTPDRAERDRMITEAYQGNAPKTWGALTQLSGTWQRALDSLETDLNCSPAELAQHFERALCTVAYGPEHEWWRKNQALGFATLLKSSTLLTLSNAWKPAYVKPAERPKVDLKAKMAAYYADEMSDVERAAIARLERNMLNRARAV